ncbi:hypothetical protein FBU30_010414 [Linnemannia zychae]|nr:hypothetical protein FBU30_010414 [Linnemannia zychae]
MANCCDSDSPAPAVVDSGTPDSPIPGSTANNSPRSYSRNNNTTSSLDMNYGMKINDDTSASYGTDRRLRRISQEHSSPDELHQSHCSHCLNEVAQRGSSQDCVEHSHSVENEEEALSIVDKDSGQTSEDEHDSNDAHDETNILRDEPSRGEPQACLFVASLAATRTDTQLVESVTEHFQKWGTLLNVKVLKDWMQRPYSFVQFENVEDAQRAMIEAQNTLVDGRHIRIEQARVNRTLFILRFSRSTTEQDLMDVLEQYGPIEDVSIFHDPRPATRNKRYAFAKFAYRDDAIKAYVALRATSKWTIEWAPNLSSQNQIEKESIFIGQLNPDQVTETALHDRFQAYGSIKSVYLIKRNKQVIGRPTAFAFIEYDSERAARRAIENENNTQFLETTIRVQHRETNEYRAQRQNAAMQAARSLIDMSDMSYLSGMPVNLHSTGYGHDYQHYRGNIGRSMSYVPYYGFANVSAHGYYGPFPSRSSTAISQSDGSPHSSSSSNDGPQFYYHGSNQYNQQGNQSDKYISNQDARQGQRPGSYEYTGYSQAPDGMYYPPPHGPAIPGSMYLYDQHNPGALSASSIQAPGKSMHGGPILPLLHGAGPSWCPIHPSMPGSSNIGTGNGGIARRPGLLEVSALIPPRHTGSSQNRAPESTRPAEARSSTRKTN